MVDSDFSGDTPDLCRDLSNGDELAYVDDRGACEDHDGPSLTPDLGKPDLASRHSAVQACAVRQKSSTTSGARR